MAYSKTTWVNGQTPINDTNLNKIENELEALDTGLSTLSTTVSGKQDELTAGDNITIENNVISASGGSAQTDYTTGVEMQIGTWDNKPLYRKIITGTLPSTTRTNKTLDTISNLGKILTLTATIGYTSPRNQFWAYPFPVITSDTYSSILINGNNQIIVRWESNASAWVDSPVVVIIEYTKTTD